MLCSDHFEDLDTSYRGREFDLCIKVSQWDREDFVADDIDLSTPPARVELNPRKPGLRDLIEVANAAQERDPDDLDFNLQIGLPNGHRYERKVKWYDSPDGPECSHTLVLVGLVERKPVGFMTVGLHISQEREMKWVFLTLKLELVYVLPACRGNGYGLDLSFGCARLGSDLMTALYRAIPSGYELQVTIDADYDSKGGRRVARSIHSDCAYRRDLLLESEGRSDVQDVRVELDAGW